jgi:hypothetical protein
MEPTTPPPPAALIEAVERALAPLRGRFSPERIELLRREALLQLAAHPYPAALARALSAPKVVQESHVVGPGAEAPPVSAGGKGAR